MSYKADITKALYKLNVRSPDTSNAGSYIADVFFWETIEKLAGGKLDDAWRALVRNHLIPDDNHLREHVNGETVLSKTKHFVVEAKISNPRAIFDKDAFIRQVSEKFKVPKHKLDELAAQCVSHTRAPLTKRVLEVG